MRKMLAVLCAIGLLALLLEPAAESSPNYSQQIATALKTARQAETTAKAALTASKRILLSIKGSVGATGERGTDGLSGAPGASGSAGSNGANGNNGSEGPTGPQGPRGAQGLPGSNVKAYGHVTADGTGTQTQGVTATHPGSGLYCLTDQGFVAVVVTPDSWNATAFALPPADPHGSCGSSAWTVVVNNNSGVDTGFYLVAN